MSDLSFVTLPDDAPAPGVMPEPCLSEIDRLRRATNVRRLLVLRERHCSTKIAAACEVALIMLSGTEAFAEYADLAQLDPGARARVREWGWPFADADSARAQLALELAGRSLDLPSEAFERVRDEPTNTADPRLLYLVGAVRAAKGASLPWFVPYSVANTPTLVLRSIWSRASSRGWFAWGWCVHKLGLAVLLVGVVGAVLVSAWALVAYLAFCLVDAPLGLDPVRAGIWTLLATCAALDKIQDSPSLDVRTSILTIAAGFAAPASLVGQQLFSKVDAAFENQLPVWSQHGVNVLTALAAVAIAATMPIGGRLAVAAGLAVAIPNLVILVWIFELVPGATPPIIANAPTLRLLEQLRADESHS